ncbi:hypothetical protein [Actinomadura alba]|uniref:Uncharacterized protein n=1 Tax=Actinomadura alba TaxID=406431 RepID=A0ABR7LZ65_9ACTN|nr:hypothetical protein [Actinomadura alba]MBC6470150.1 hypothetical protein [Actinomadura alba]
MEREETESEETEPEEIESEEIEPEEIEPVQIKREAEEEWGWGGRRRADCGGGEAGMAGPSGQKS